MADVRTFYDARVRPMVAAERLQLARLILDDLAPVDVPVSLDIDESDAWSDEDLADVTGFSARQAARPDGATRP